MTRLALRAWDALCALLRRVPALPRRVDVDAATPQGTPARGQDQGPHSVAGWPLGTERVLWVRGDGVQAVSEWNRHLLELCDVPGWVPEHVEAELERCLAERTVIRGEA